MQYSVEMMKDLTEEDEDNLPLPDDWVRTIRMSSSKSPDRSNKIYRNLKTGVESEEHPFILQALNMSRKRTLPVGWIVKEVLYKDGTKDYSYYNTELGISMWDPPLLRECLSECLLHSGFNPYALNILPGGDPSQEYHHPHNNHFGNEAREEEDDDGLIQYFNQPVEAGDEDEESLVHFYNPEDLPECVPPSDDRNHHPLANNVNRLSLDDLNDTAEDVYGEVSSMDDSQVNRTRNWQGLLDSHVEKNNIYAEKLSHRVRQVKPPISSSGVAVLKSDVTEANERIHQLIIKLRTVLCTKMGVECSFLYHSNSISSNNINDLHRHHQQHNPETASSDYDAIAEMDLQQRNRYVTLASDIVTTLRQHPEHIVLAMAATNKAGNPAMIQIAFTALHRLLHPFSTDNSMTTAILLQGINYQLDEMTLVEQIFSDMDAKRILSRALLISDPVLAIKWNPLSAPLPVVPIAKEETVLACLLRLYAIRRDVTSYYRTTWKPMIPSVIAVLNSDRSGAHVFGNLMAVANRLLECTLLEKSMLSFPPTATAICRAMHEIGGNHTLHSYLFSFLILPNLVKILAGDHESVENENLYRLETIRGFVDKYFDSSLWFSNDHEEQNSPYYDGSVNGAMSVNSRGPVPFNLLRALIWLVWRLYMHAIYVRGSALTVLTTQDFVGNRLPHVDLSAVPDNKLKNIVERLHRKIDRAAEYLLKLPLDAQGSEYLGIDRSTNLMPVSDNAELNKLLNKRLSSLHFKPNEMLNLGVVSKQDIGNLFTDVGVALEMSGQSDNSSLYQAIAEYLSLCSLEDGDESREELVQLIFLYTKNGQIKNSQSRDNITDLLNDNREVEDEETFESDVELNGRYHQLLRGLTLTNRYEDILIQMIYRAENDKNYTIFDLVPPGVNNKPSTDFTEGPPEFDANLGIEDVRLARTHTAVSVQKLKHSHYGLHTPAEVSAVPLFHKHTSEVMEREDRKSHKAKDDQFFSSYRFGTSSSSVNAGTSMGRVSKVLPPKLKADAVSVTKVNVKAARTKNTRSQYTKVTIKSDSILLAPTESTKSQGSYSTKETGRERDKVFMKNMRDYEVIPAEEFQQRHNKRMKAHLQQSEDDTSTDAASRRRTSRSASNQRRRPNMNTPSMAPIHAPQPFPEYLRHRVRPEDGVDNSWQEDSYAYGGGGGNGVPSGSASVQSRARSIKSVGSSKKKSKNGVNSDQISQIIQDYRQVFPNAQPHSLSYQPDPTIDNVGRAYSNTSSGHRLTVKGPKPPTMPEPIPGTNFFAPTQSLLRKLEQENAKSPLKSSSNMKQRHLEDIHNGAPPGLRSYPNTNNFVAPPFVPVKTRHYAPTGARVPRIPDFLSDSGGSRASSRSNSRASSPAFSRSSRNNSFNNLSRFGAEDSQYDDDYYPRGGDEARAEDSNYYTVDYGSPEAFQEAAFNVEYDDASARFVLNSKKTPSALQSDEVFKQQQVRQQQELQQEEQEYLRRKSINLSNNNPSNSMSQVKSPIPVRHSIPVAAPPSDASVDSTPSARKRVPIAATSETIPIIAPRSRDDGYATVLNRTPMQQAALTMKPELILSPNPVKLNNANSSNNAWNAAVSAAISSAADDMKQTPSRRASDTQARTPNPTSPMRRSSMSASIPVSTTPAAAPPAVVTVEAPPPPPSPKGSTSHVAPIVAQLGGSGAYRRSSTGSVAQVQHAPSNNNNNNGNTIKSPQNRRASVGVAPVSSSAPIIIIPPSASTDSVTRPPLSQSQSLLSPLASVTPLKQSSGYSLKFDHTSVDPSEHDNDIHYHRYDTKLDSELAAARLNTAGLKEFLGSDEEDSEELRDSRYIMDSPKVRFGEGRFTDSPLGRIPIIKKKSMILTKDESKMFLINGFKATKHGRSGAPKLKFVCYNEEEHTIDWESAQTSMFSSLFSTKGKHDQVSFIDVDDVIEVRRGIQTQVFMKAKLVDPRCCLSIVTEDRTLDLVMSSPSERDTVIKGLAAVLENNVKVRFL